MVYFLLAFNCIFLSRYATTLRDSRRSRERDFLKKVHDCVDQGGKVLIPVFALGRAQELCILIESYWERMNIRVPVYFSAGNPKSKEINFWQSFSTTMIKFLGLTEKANHFYRLFINWTNQKIKNSFIERQGLCFFIN
jgi:integrator complex subunit 11